MAHFGYKLWEWQSETKMNRAQLIAHYLHRTLREAYLDEHATKKGKGEKSKGTRLKSMMNAMGIG
jgi:hypothetical protein